ncbi:sulfite exporter TauE/SafE family protein [Ottowia sp. GY511]|nr:sulfite exporter TauE/SafE family protein [Ottowia sp. GY511]
MMDWAYPAAVIALGYVVLGLTGFGSALVAVPLLAWRWPLVDVVPMVLLIDVLASLLMGGLNLREVRWDEARRLLPGMVLGALLGLWLAQRATSAAPLIVLGAYVVWVGAQALRARPLVAGAAAASPGWLGALYGAGVGLVEILFGTAGPLVLAWLARQRVDARGMRASTPAIIMVAALGAIALMAVDGRLASGAIWQRLLVLLPVAVVSVLAGHALAHRVPTEALRRCICGLLILSGAMLILNALRRLG